MSLMNTWSSKRLEYQLHIKGVYLGTLEDNKNVIQIKINIYKNKF